MEVAKSPAAATFRPKRACSSFAVRNSKTTASCSPIERVSPSPVTRPDCEELMKSARHLGNENFNQVSRNWEANRWYGGLCPPAVEPKLAIAQPGWPHP